MAHGRAAREGSRKRVVPSQPQAPPGQERGFISVSHVPPSTPVARDGARRLQEQTQRCVCASQACGGSEVVTGPRGGPRRVRPSGSQHADCFPQQRRQLLQRASGGHSPVPHECSSQCSLGLLPLRATSYVLPAVCPRPCSFRPPPPCSAHRVAPCRPPCAGLWSRYRPRPRRDQRALPEVGVSPAPFRGPRGAQRPWSAPGSVAGSEPGARRAHAGLPDAV